jgi:hypothetical protein
MRDFDLRVGWHNDLAGPGYYAEHGDIYSPYLTLPVVFD